jgi:CRISPR-associated exonuclease Cas4
MTLLYLSLGVLVVAVALWGLAAWQQSRAGLPPGRVIHVDTTRLRPPEGTFFSANLGLTGRPDYLVNRAGVILPIEVKSGDAPAAPYASHIFQLAAYGLLVEEHFGSRPPYGILKYRDRAIQIPLTDGLMDSVKSLLQEMRRDADAKRVDRSHEERARCAACGFRTSCDQSLQ